MTVTASKSNQYLVGSISPRFGITKSNAYLIVSPAVQVSKSNAYAVLLDLGIKFEKVGQIFPFSLGNSIWAVPLYVKRKDN